MTKKETVLRCPKCGGSDVKLNPATGKLRCGHCRAEFDQKSANEAGSVDILHGKIIDEGAKRIISEDAMVSLRCSSCGAISTINTDEAMNARCAWCRHILSITDKQPNGAVPDLILPFKVTQKRAVELMAPFVSKKRMFVNKKFQEEFKPENVMGVYLPYMVVDMNVHATMSGEGEVEIRHYTVGSGDDEETRYDADLYHVTREFDLEIDDLTVEASYEKLKHDKRSDTNNIINAILPFDTENAVEWDPRFVRGFSCERRDLNVPDLDRKVKNQTEDIMRFQMRGTLANYDRGVRWDQMRLEQKGVKWRTAYLPVWLYSFLNTSDKKHPKMCYVAVNARTEEIIGSAPVDKKLLQLWVFGIPAALGVLGLFLGLMEEMTSSMPDLGDYGVLLGGLGFWWFVIAGIIALISSSKSTNGSIRHIHEAETRASIKNLKEKDEFVKARKGLSASYLYGRNDMVRKDAAVATAKIDTRRVSLPTGPNKLREAGRARDAAQSANLNKTALIIIAIIFGSMFIVPILMAMLSLFFFW